MQDTYNTGINNVALQSVVIEIKLHINQKLYQAGAITEEMYTKAKDLILRSTTQCANPTKS